MGEHRQFSHDSLGSRRMVIGKHLWPKFCRSIQMYCDWTRDIRSGARNRIGRFSYRIKQSFHSYRLQATAESFTLRQQEPKKWSQIKPAVTLASVPHHPDKYLAESPQKVRGTQFWRWNWPWHLCFKSLREAAARETMVQTLGTADTDGLTPKDWKAISWLSDLLESLIFFCCVKGQTEALKTFTIIRSFAAPVRRQHKHVPDACAKNFSKRNQFFLEKFRNSLYEAQKTGRIYNTKRPYDLINDTYMGSMTNGIL
ncbi:hypothetical protein CCUS01_00158 [Colletotrichum cuscutae]|uniref:Uncharacterized protein n=1 Tax=Colletotrichum cuscutae TaxID=1209917 RepID=A0AAI9YE12_9PEZI|nr:hypothetical protein CCUS01_00158 [Colletotrichum cuscutae]